MATELPDGQQYICAGPVCKCSASGDECSCREENGGCIDCGRTMLVIDIDTGKPVAAAAADPRQVSLL